MPRPLPSHGMGPISGLARLGLARLGLARHAPARLGPRTTWLRLKCHAPYPPMEWAQFLASHDWASHDWASHDMLPQGLGLAQLGSGLNATPPTLPWNGPNFWPRTTGPRTTGPRTTCSRKAWASHNLARA